MIYCIKCISKEYPKLEWPLVFEALPSRGDLIRSVASGDEKPTTSLRVINITHTTEKRQNIMGGTNGAWFQSPIIEIELGDTLEQLRTHAFRENPPIIYATNAQRRSGAFTALCEKAAIARAGWVPDFSDPMQRKYYPKFKAIPKDGSAGLTVKYDGAGYTHQNTFVGAGLSFETEEMTEQFARENISLYEILLLTQ